jgi:hypothetical protein
MSKLKEMGFYCRNIGIARINDCSYNPATGLFSHITIALHIDDSQTNAAFTVRKNLLTLGDLALLWGKPNIEAGDHTLYLEWPDNHASAIASDYDGRFTYFLPIMHVFIDLIPFEDTSGK